MAVSPPVPAPTPQLWSITLPHRPLGLALAREKALALLWDRHHWLYLFNRQGLRQGQFLLPASINAACCAEDGSCFAAIGAGGEVWWLAPDLSIRWQRSMPAPTVAAAMDSFGQYLAVSDERGALHIFDNQGRPITQVSTPRPLHYLAFVPAAARLIGSSDFGLVTCFDLRGGQLWRDGLIHNAGALTVNGDGSTILLACYTEGMHRYALDGKGRTRLPTPEPCYLAHLSYDGRFILAASLNSRVLLLDIQARILWAHPVDKPAVAVGLSPLGDTAIVALKDGVVTSFDLSAFVG